MARMEPRRDSIAIQQQIIAQQGAASFVAAASASAAAADQIEAAVTGDLLGTNSQLRDVIDGINQRLDQIQEQLP